MLSVASKHSILTHLTISIYLPQIITITVGATGIFANARTQDVKDKVSANGFIDSVIDAAIDNL
jgi:hypothetical protein